MTNTYLDSIAYLKQPTGLILNNYVGNNARLASPATAGASSLTVVAGQAPISMYDAVYVFDGSSSEIVQAGSDVAPGVATIPLLNPTQFAHVAGTVYCTDGLLGSLGEQIFTASKWIEDVICFQPLWSTTYTGEILTMPTMRASIDNQRNIHFRPRHFPIGTITSMVLQDQYQNQYALSASSAIIDSDQQTVDIPLSALVSSNTSQATYPWGSAINRGATSWIVLTYTAGFAAGAMPKTVERACALLVNDLFVPLENPVGADQITQGKRAVTYAIRGDVSGDSELVKRAAKLLAPYVTQAF